MKLFYTVLLFLSVFILTSCTDDPASGPCKDVKCSNHGTCNESGGRAVCECDEGYYLDGEQTCLKEDETCDPACSAWEACIADQCKLRSGYCNDNNDCSNGTCDANHTCTGSQYDPCNGVDCGNGGTCSADGYGYGAKATCECPTGFHAEDLKCVVDVVVNKCATVTCDSWKECNEENGNCELIDGKCGTDNDCTDNKICDLSENSCIADPCSSVDCGANGVCSSFGTNASCNCNDGFTPDGLSCVVNTAQVEWCGIKWFGGPTGSENPNPINVFKDYTGDNSRVYTQIYQPNITNVDNEQAFIKAEVGYTTGNITYPVNYNQLTWVSATWNVRTGNDHEYMINFPTSEIGEFKFISRFSIDNGDSWTYCDAVPSPNKITSSDISYGTAKVFSASERVKELKYNKDLNIDGKSYSFTVTYTGNSEIDFENSTFFLNGVAVDLESNYNTETKTFTISADNVENNKYTYLFRVIDTNSVRSQTVYVPIWIEDEAFAWKDGFIYQIMTDRFSDGDASNNAPVPGVDEDKNWQGGDFKGIIEKIESGYFSDMGANILWISSPILNTDGKGKGTSDGKWYSAYHSYWPIATGWTDTNHLEGIDSPIDPHFGTEEELKELIRVAHKNGIRVLADFVANHVFAITNSNDATGSESPWGNVASYFHGLNNPYVCGWEQPITCWFTNYLPDFNYSNPLVLNEVMDHAIWMIQEYDFDGYRLDAVKHMIMDFTTTIRQRIKDEVETTGYDFYTVGETFTFDAAALNEYVGDDKLFGQFEFTFYEAAANQILRNGNLNDLKSFTEWNDDYYTSRWSGALMSNFLGNHDVDRALRKASGSHMLLKLGHTFLMTSPRIPLIYQGDEFGIDGGGDPDNRRFMRFDLVNDELSTRTHLQKLGLFRAQHKAVRRGTRSTCGVSNDFYVYKMTKDEDIVIVGINKGSSAANATCTGVSGSFKDAFTGDTVNFNGSVVVPANSSFVIGKE